MFNLRQQGKSFQMPFTKQNADKQQLIITTTSATTTSTSRFQNLFKMWNQLGQFAWFLKSPFLGFQLKKMMLNFNIHTSLAEFLLNYESPFRILFVVIFLLSGITRDKSVCSILYLSNDFFLLSSLQPLYLCIYNPDSWIYKRKGHEDLSLKFSKEIIGPL